MSSNEEKVRALVHRERIAEILTCPICKLLFRDATAVSKCLHTFCKKCIQKKILKEDLHHCPICKFYLGPNPLKELRPDHNLQDLRDKILAAAEIQSAKQPELAAGSSQPSLPDEKECKRDDETEPSAARPKERSISALVSQLPQNNNNNDDGPNNKKTGLRSTRKKRSTGLSIQDPIPIVSDESLEKPTAATAKSKTAQKRNKQISATGESSSHYILRRKGKEPMETLNRMTTRSMWKPLNCLVEAATDDKVQQWASELAPSGINQGDQDTVLLNNNKVKGHRLNKSRNHSSVGGSKPERPKKNDEGLQKAAILATEAPRNLAGPVAGNASGIISSANCNPIWFSLVASDAQEGDPPLPQISSGYLRVKNPKMPVSFIQKYIAQKLDLQSEAEAVEITLQGMAVPPTFLLEELLDAWLQQFPASEKIETEVGNSAEALVMVLHYGRKAQLNR